MGDRIELFSETVNTLAAMVSVTLYDDAYKTKTIDVQNTDGVLRFYIDEAITLVELLNRAIAVARPEIKCTCPGFYRNGDCPLHGYSGQISGNHEHEWHPVYYTPSVFEDCACGARRPRITMRDDGNLRFHNHEE
jgi:hypothetical protein